MSRIFLFVLWSFCLQAQHPLNIVREELTIPMRDGVKLFAIAYRPDIQGKFPVIMYRTPYGATNYDRSAEFPLKAAKEGYIVFIVDVRGRYKSEGAFEAYRHEKEDGYDAIEWAGHQYEYSNGRVGTYGGSYPGFVQWLAMSQAPPSLKAAVPALTPVHSHQFFYVGGAFSFGWLDWFATLMLPDLRKRAGDKSGTWDGDSAATRWEAEKWKWYFHRPLKEVPMLRTYVPYYSDWLAHPERTSFWDFANAASDFARMPAPALIHTGWYDAVYGLAGATEGFNKLRKEAASDYVRDHTRLIIGPWNHTTPGVRKSRFGWMENGVSAGLDFDRLLMSWFDQHLKEKNAERTAPVSVFVMGANKWRYENEWPLSRAEPTSYYLHGQATLDTEKPGRQKADVYTFDPNFTLVDSSYQKPYPFDQRPNESRSDVLVYSSAPLTEDIEVTGQVTLELYVSSSARDTDFSFTLCDVYPDGTSINLASLESGYLRMRYRNGTDRQELIRPGEIYQINIDNYYTSNLFRKGHRIRVSVTSSKFPHYDINTNTGTDLSTETQMIKAIQTLYHDKDHPSRLILPVIPPHK